MNSVAPIRCLVKTTAKPSVQGGCGRCSKVLNEYVLKNGERIQEVISDYGNGLRAKSEIFLNRIVNTASDGSIIEYTKNNLGEVLVKEGSKSYLSNNPKLWQNLMFNIYKGF